jgi:hypothetical protein
MLYTYYSQYNRLDTPQIKSDFETLYHQLTGKPLRELDNIIDTVTTLCWHHEKSGFTEGIKLGILLATELEEEEEEKIALSYCCGKDGAAFAKAISLFIVA